MMNNVLSCPFVFNMCLFSHNNVSVLILVNKV